MESNALTRFIGGSPARVVFHLIVVSFFVGLAMHAFGVSPYDIVNGLRDLAWRIYMMGFGSVEWIIRYLILGAVVVVPIWFVMRLFKMGKRS